MRHPRLAALAAAVAVAIATLVVARPVAADEPIHSFKLEVETGTWEPLSQGPCGFTVLDAVLLANGDIAVMETTRTGPLLVEVYSPNTGTMARVELDTWSDRGWGQFARGLDSRLYSAYWTIDPSVDPWHLEPSTRRTLVDDPGWGAPMGVATNGLGYLLDTSVPGGDRLVELDLASDTELRRTAPVDGDANWWVFGGEPRNRIYLIHHWDAIIASYDPADDTWRTESSPYSGPMGLERDRSAFGPDGRIYAFNEYYQPSTLWAWDPTSDEWMSVGQPSDLQYWYPQLVAADGQLYAFAGTNDAKLIDEGESAEGCQVAAPEVVPTATPVARTMPDVALPAPAGPDGSLLQITGLAVLALLLALVTARKYGRP